MSAEITRLRAVIAKDAAQIIEDQHKMHKAAEVLREVIDFACALNNVAAGQNPEQLDRWYAVLAALAAERANLDKAAILQAAGQEYVLEHASETAAERMGRRSAVRGMMVRMGLYAELEDAIEAAITKGAAT